LVTVEAPLEVPDVGATVTDAVTPVGDTVGVTVTWVGWVGVAGAAGVGVGGSTVATVVVSTRPGPGDVDGAGAGVTARVTFTALAVWSGVEVLTAGLTEVFAEVLTELGADFEGLGGWC